MLTPEQLIAMRLCTPVYDCRVKSLLDHINVQQARIDELEKDAARYRALREAVIEATKGRKHHVEHAITQAMRESHTAGHGAELTAANMDAAIDAAMQK